MAKDKRQKARNILRDKAILAVGIVGSLVVLIPSGLNLIQTYRGNSVPQRILDVKPELDRSWEALAESDDFKKKREIIIDLEKTAKEQRLGVTRMACWSLSHLQELEQALSSQENLSQDQIRQLLSSFDVSFWRSFRYSIANKNPNIESSWILSHILSQPDLELRNLERKNYKLWNYKLWILTWKNFRWRNLKRNLEQDLEKWNLERRNLEQGFEQNFERYLELDLQRRGLEVNLEWQDLEQGFEQDFERDFEQQGFELNLEQNFERDFQVRDLEWDLFKQLILLKRSLWQLERGETPEISIEELSQQIISESKRIYEQELAQSYGLRADRESYTANQRQVKLIQFAFLAAISAIGLSISALLLTRWRNQKITLNTITWSFVPEECIGELDEELEQLKLTDKDIWEIRLIMLQRILVLLTNLYIQVAIEDLFLPGKNKRD